VLVFQLTRSAQFVGLVTIAQFAAPLLLAPLGGALADRLDRRLLLMAAQATSGLAVAGLAAAAAGMGGIGLTSPLPLLAVSFLLGVCIAVADPARHALLPALVAKESLAPAIALNGVTFNLGRAVGPAVAGAGGCVRRLEPRRAVLPAGRARRGRRPRRRHVIVAAGHDCVAGDGRVAAPRSSG
jgi:MFS family permease